MWTFLQSIFVCLRATRGKKSPARTTISISEESHSKPIQSKDEYAIKCWMTRNAIWSKMSKTYCKHLHPDDTS